MKTSKGVLLSLALFFCLVILSGCCELFPSLPWCPPQPGPQIDTLSFTPGAIMRLCPDHVGGDREFEGHGPDVTVRAFLEMKNSDKEIWVSLYLNAKETRDDWTEAEGRWQRHLWTVPPEYNKIVNIVSHQSSNASYRDTDHDLDRPEVQGGSLVHKFEIMGDTGGNDVGNCTDDDVYMNVYFNTIRVQAEKID